MNFDYGIIRIDKTVIVKPEHENNDKDLGVKRFDYYWSKVFHSDFM